jgi:hypothetical protein
MRSATTFPEARWQWWAGDDEEHLTIGPHKTRADAIKEAIDQQVYIELEPNDDEPEWRVSLYVCQGVCPTVLDMVIYGDRFLEDLDTRYEDWSYEEALFINVTRDEEEDLGRVLTEALHAWAVRHGISFPNWSFQESRHEQTVVMPHPVPPKS